MFNKKSISAIVGTAFVASLSVGVVNATENPFSAKTLSSGYQVAEHNPEHKEVNGKCATGKCGAKLKAKTEKAKDGSCSANKTKDGSCSANKPKVEKETEGSCGANKAKAEKEVEGSCGAK